MGMFDFIKKIFEEEKAEEVRMEKVIFSDIGKWIDEKKKEVEVKERNVFGLVSDRLEIFMNEIKSKINVVENFSLEGRKVEDRIKSLTVEGRKKYIEFINDFIDDINSLEKNNLEEFGKKIDKIFLDFNNHSKMSYERATLLIGKEMADVKETLKRFTKDLIKIFEDNKDVIGSLKIFSTIGSKLRKIDDVDKEIEKSKLTISSLNEQINKKERENKAVLDDIENVKKSRGYVENLKRRDEIKLRKEELQKEIVMLKQTIDFKALANFYHIFEDKMKELKEHRDNFQKMFEKDNGESILKLIDESKLNNKNISQKMREIKNKKKIIFEEERKITADKTQELYSLTTKIILDIGNLKNERGRVEKRLEKLRAEKKELVENVKKNVESVGGEVE